MLTLVTGSPGSGKTVRLVGIILAAAKLNRVVYARVDGLTVDGVLPAPDDWQDCTDGALVIYDEAQELFPATGGSGPTKDLRVKGMERHRHRGIDIVFATQHPTLIDVHIRKLLGKHYHHERKFGFEASKVLEAERVIDLQKPQGCQKYVWKYPKENYGYFESATIHTVKGRIPRKVFYGIGLLLFIFGGFFWYLFSGDGMIGRAARGDGPSAVVSSDDVGLQRVGLDGRARVNNGHLPKTLMGCIWNEDRCHCYGMDGLIMPWTYEECFIQVSEPWAIRVKSGGGGGAGVGEAASGLVGEAVGLGP